MEGKRNIYNILERFTIVVFIAVLLYLLVLHFMVVK